MRGKKIRGIIGIILMAAAVAAMYLWLTYGQEALATKQVLLANMDIEQGTIIDPEKHFKASNIDTDSLISEGLTKANLQDLKGMAAKQFIPKNAQLSSRYFAKESMVLSGDKAVFKIPDKWIYAVPTSIRRGDDINIYEIDSDIEKNINGGINKLEGGLNTYSNKFPIQLSSDKPILATAVLYVKDSTNREVVDADERKRFDGTSQVSSIEIVCTKEEMKSLEKKVAEGMQLVIAYH